jgi:uncharacterized alpha-E superfamily protein
MLSRTANNLFWMARYVERAENTARILDVTYRMSLMPQDPSVAQKEWFAPLNITGTLFPFSGRYSTVCAHDVLRYMVLDPGNPSSIFSCAKAARENARAVRSAITSEMWEVLNSTWLELQHFNESRLDTEGVSHFFDWVKERSHLFRGVTVGTALKDQAFQFNRLGIFLERSDNTARILDVKYHVLLPSLEDVGGAVDYYQWAALLKSLSGFEAYRRAVPCLLPSLLPRIPASGRADRFRVMHQRFGVSESIPREPRRLHLEEGSGLPIVTLKGQARGRGRKAIGRCELVEVIKECG